MKLVNFTNDIITVPEGKEEALATTARIIDLTSMILLFIGKHNIDEDTEGERSSRQFIKLVYAAYDDNENMYLLVQYYAYEHEDEKDFEIMQKCKYFDGSLSNEQLVTTINFFTGSMTPYTVDFINTLNEDTNKYEFYGVRDGGESGPDCIKFTISEKIRLGLEMIYKMVGNNQALDNCIVDANVWMYNDNNEESGSYRNIYKQFTAKSFEIRDISRSTKKARGVYVGIVAIEFFCDGEKENDPGIIYTAILPYRRTEKLRRRDLTMDMALMETKYENGYVVGSYSACPIEADNSTRRLIAYCQKFKRFIIIDFDTEKYNEFIDKINSIGE